MLVSAVGIGSSLALLGLWLVGGEPAGSALDPRPSPAARQRAEPAVTLRTERFGEFNGPPAVFEVREPVVPPASDPRFIVYGTQGGAAYLTIELVLEKEALPSGQVRQPLGDPAREAGVSQVSLGQGSEDFYSTAGMVTLKFEGHHFSGSFEAALRSLNEGSVDIRIAGTISGRWTLQCQVIAGHASEAASPGASRETAIQWRTDRELRSHFCASLQARLEGH
jgi:hypothetical protein